MAELVQEYARQHGVEAPQSRNDTLLRSGDTREFPGPAGVPEHVTEHHLLHIGGNFLVSDTHGVPGIGRTYRTRRYRAPRVSPALTGLSRDAHITWHVRYS